MNRCSSTLSLCERVMKAEAEKRKMVNPCAGCADHTWGAHARHAVGCRLHAAAVAEGFVSAASWCGMGCGHTYHAYHAAHAAVQAGYLANPAHLAGSMHACNLPSSAHCVHACRSVLEAGAAWLSQGESIRVWHKGLYLRGPTFLCVIH